MSKKIILDVDQVKEQYLKLKTIQAVAKYFRISKSAMANFFRQNNINYILKHKNNFNENYFSINTPESLYLAGFLAADGCIKNNSISLELSDKDLNHLMKIKNLLQCNAKINKRIRYKSKENSNWKDSGCCNFTCSSKETINDLKRFNIIPNKTKTYTFPEWLISHSLVHHFMRGYFDGDGSFYHDKFSKRTFFSIRGTINFLNDFKNILKIKSISLPKINNGQGQLAFKGQKDVANIVNFLYKDATIFLQRKKLLVEKFL